jgi:lipopolysaccharide/colanic/teichoic acid biosynthesis glycosyltransferase
MFDLQQGREACMLTEIAPTQRLVHPNKAYLRAKRVFDLVLTLLILLPLCLVIAVIAVIIRLDSKGPIFFRQKRMGLNGVEFEMYKFRSMYDKCDEALHRQAIARYVTNQRLNTGAETTQYKQVDDPRVTRVGQFLRKKSLDELPQFFNVLQGDMSLVGPRPPLDYEVALYSEHDLLRLCGKPGLTGIWQVYGRSRVPFAEMVEMDITYLQQQSIWLDLKLILLTMPVMLLGNGGV